VKHEAVICTTVCMTRRSPLISPYNAVGNAATTASQLLQHSSEFQRWCHKRPHSPAAATVSPLHSMRWLPEFAHYAEYGGMEGRTEYRLFIRERWLSAFFTNLARWKFPYENRLVEISRESYNILAYERCPHTSTARFWPISLHVVSANLQCICVANLGGLDLSTWNMSIKQFYKSS